MVREGFIRPRGPGSISHLPRRKTEQRAPEAPAPVLTPKERTERIAALLNRNAVEGQQAGKLEQGATPETPEDSKKDEAVTE